MTGGILNLSLLSRGVGEVHSNGHEKVDVYLEPEDYYNFTTHPERLYLPPLRTNFDHDLDGSQYTTRSLKDSQAYRVPKTFTTRKGALLLFSEDLAQRNTERASKGKNPAHNHSDVSASADSQISLRTVEDLTQSILKYGAQDSMNGKVYLKFLPSRPDNYERQIRPGFSAKRYLATWTRTWDNSVLDNVIKQGYITERLMKNMLLTPSSLSGYTFYRVPTDLITLDEQMEEVDLGSRERPGTVRSIQVIRTADDVQEVVDYHELDRDSQTNVITDLLVKSAVHYALRKQEEIIESSLKRSLNRQGDFDEAEAGTLEFDMKEAVEVSLRYLHIVFQADKQSDFP
ncbi:hypothetical protein Btru_005090 [Bulinus truncatus]|nr:hypothetical protein Btru_005090 [Bulinus truncatus]